MRPEARPQVAAPRLELARRRQAAEAAEAAAEAEAEAAAEAAEAAAEAGRGGGGGGAAAGGGGVAAGGTVVTGVSVSPGSPVALAVMAKHRPSSRIRFCVR